MLTPRMKKSLELGEDIEGKCFGCGRTIKRVSAGDLTIWKAGGSGSDNHSDHELCRYCVNKIKNGALKKK